MPRVWMQAESRLSVSLERRKFRTKAICTFAKKLARHSSWIYRLECQSSSHWTSSWNLSCAWGIVTRKSRQLWVLCQWTGHQPQWKPWSLRVGRIAGCGSLRASEEVSGQLGKEGFKGTILDSELDDCISCITLTRSTSLRVHVHVGHLELWYLEFIYEFIDDMIWIFM